MGEKVSRIINHRFAIFEVENSSISENTIMQGIIDYVNKYDAQDGYKVQSVCVLSTNDKNKTTKFLAVLLWD